MNPSNGISAKASSFGEGLAPIVPQFIEKEEKWFDKNELNLAPVQWGLIALNMYKGVSFTEKMLPAGVYDIGIDGRDGKPIFSRKNIVHDTVLPLSGLPSKIVSEIEEFWTKEEEFKELGFLHRRGYLLYGSHGTGKSSIIHDIMDRIVKEKGIVFFCDNPSSFNEGLSHFRQLEPNRRIVCIFEDIDAIVKRYGEALLLSILDGENQVSGVCNIASTNYPELLDKRIVGRPRRFDRVYKIGKLDNAARKAFLEKKLPKGAPLEEWVKKTEDLTIAQISEVIITVFAFKKPIEEAVQIVTELAQDKSSNDGEADVGFGRG